MLATTKLNLTSLKLFNIILIHLNTFVNNIFHHMLTRKL